MPIEKPILIAGAGPTGLTLAHCLAAYGVPFDIIDLRPGPSRDSKALVLNVLSQYQLALLGLGNAIGRDAIRIRRANVHWNDTLRLNALDFRWLDFPIRSFIAQPQAATERDLIAALPSNVSIERNTRLQSAVEENSGVVVQLQDANGTVRRRRYEYVVGCEGKNSVVRQSIGSELKGSDYPMHFILGDFKLRWDRPADQAYYHVYEDTFFVVVPIGNGYWRIVVKKDGAFNPGSQLTARDVTDSFERYIGSNLIEGDPVWLSGAPFYMRVATVLQSERMFIAGDAAHLFSPIGGTGMNTGIQDAVNLGWKLAYERLGIAVRGALLPTYSLERGQAIREAAMAADFSTRLIARLETSPERIKPMLPALERRKLLRHDLPNRQAGMSLEYGPSIVVQSSKSPTLVRAGTVCRGLLDLNRDVALQADPARPCDMTILAFLDHPGSASEQALAALERGLRPYLVAPLRLRVIALGDMAVSRPVSCTIRDKTTLRRLGATPGGLLAVRPDGMIAFSGTLLESRGLLEMIERWFGARNRSSYAAPQASADSQVDGAE